MTAQRMHIFNEAGQLGELLRDFRLRNEGALTAPYLHQPTADEILNGLADRCATHGKLFG